MPTDPFQFNCTHKQRGVSASQGSAVGPNTAAAAPRPTAPPCPGNRQREGLLIMMMTAAMRLVCWQDPARTHTAHKKACPAVIGARVPPSCTCLLLAGLLRRRRLLYQRPAATPHHGTHPLLLLFLCSIMSWLLFPPCD